MSSHTDDLRAVSEERVALPEGFEISKFVRRAAAAWPLLRQERVDMVCGGVSRSGRPCAQVVVPVRLGDGTYEYSAEEYEGLVLAHMMQCHGWTRESAGVG